MKDHVYKASKRICEDVQKNLMTAQEAHLLMLLNYLTLVVERANEMNSGINLSNEYLAGWMNCTTRTVSAIISRLVKRKILYSAREGKSRQLLIEDARYAWLK